MIAALAIIAAVGWLLWLREARANASAERRADVRAGVRVLEARDRAEAERNLRYSAETRARDAEALAAASKEQLKAWAETLPGKADSR